MLFSCGGNFGDEGQIAKNTKITPMPKFPRLQYFLCCKAIDLVEWHVIMQDTLTVLALLESDVRLKYKIHTYNIK